MKKRIVAGVFALAVMATLKTNNGFTFTSILSTPAPNYTTYYTSSIEPGNYGGSYNHQGTITTSSSSKKFGGATAVYTNSTKGIIKAVDNMAWYATGMGSAYATTTVTLS